MSRPEISTELEEIKELRSSDEGRQEQRPQFTFKLMLTPWCRSRYQTAHLGRAVSGCALVPKPTTPQQPCTVRKWEGELSGAKHMGRTRANRHACHMCLSRDITHITPGTKTSSTDEGY